MPAGVYILVKMQWDTGRSSNRGSARPRSQLMTYSTFHVQVTDIAESAADLQTEGAIPAERKRTHDISGNLRDWELLMDAKPIPKLGESCALILLKAAESLSRHLGVKKDDGSSPANRNSGCCEDVGTQAEES